jgi:high affinity Mn2+ porin
VPFPPPAPPVPDSWGAQGPVHDAAGPAESTAKEQAAEKEKPEKKPNAEKTADLGKENGKENGKEKDKEKEEKDEDKDKKDEEKEFKVERVNAYGQFTSITQWHNPFPSPYVGPHSFLPIREDATSVTATLFLGAKLLPAENGYWPEAEAYFNPELAGGRGLSDVYGLGAVPDGDITRVGTVEPTPYVARLFMDLTWGFGGEQEKIESAANQLAQYKDVSRLTVAFGKLAATDWFDQNRYSHDPRSQFENWCLMYNGAWDYPADVRGYTYGVVAELNQENWALRYGVFAEPSEANGPNIDPNIGVAHGQAVELETRHTCCDRPGKMRWMFYWNRAHMGNYEEAIALSPHDPDVTQTATYRSVKYGVCMNIEQELSDDLGAFLRLGWNDGQTETWAFTEVDQTVAFGFVLKGARWCRKEDVVATGMAINGLSGPHRTYLADGGLGFELGDGQLSYAPEWAWETYYDCKIGKKSIWITPDFQLIGDLGDNGVRGPVAIMGVRVHAEF